jgi:hypothetical protein
VIVLKFTVIRLGRISLMGVLWERVRRTRSRYGLLNLVFFVVKDGGRVWCRGGELNDGFWTNWVEIGIAFLVLLSESCLPVL